MGKKIIATLLVVPRVTRDLASHENCHAIDELGASSLRSE